MKKPNILEFTANVKAKEVKKFIKEIEKIEIGQVIELQTRMEKYGGSFVQALAQCFYRADPQNFLKLRKTFSDYWDQYENLEEKPEPTIRHSFNGRGSNIPEGFGDDGYIK